jgi:hypothetical protein
MLCPKCKVETIIKMVKGVPTYVCRNRKCIQYQKAVKISKGSK